MKVIRKAAVFAAISAILSSTAFADTIAIGPKVGTQGIGVEGRMPVMENSFVRVGVNYFRLNADHTVKNFGSDVASTYGVGVNQLSTLLGGNYDIDVKLKGKLTLITAPIMFDYHPFDNSGFRVSAGIAYNGNKVDIKASPKPTLNGQTVSLPVNLENVIGTVKGKVKLGSSVAGLVTLGYDSSFISQSPLSFAFEAGVMYTGKPKLTVSTTGAFLGQEEVRAYLQRKARKEFKSIDNYLQIFPVISLGVKYTF